MAQPHAPGLEFPCKDMGLPFSPEHPFLASPSRMGRLLVAGQEFRDSVFYPNRFDLSMTIIIGVTFK